MKWRMTNEYKFVDLNSHTV